VEYEEFGMLADNAAEVGLPFRAPTVERRAVEVAPGQRVSAIVWGDGDPELVLIHGGAQNAHTWDTVALALDRPLVALDLPGHGHSDWRDDARYHPAVNAEAMAVAVRELAPSAAGVVGMSLGGLTTVCLAARHPELVRSAVIVDVTPGTDAEKAAPIAAFISGPESFESFDEILERTILFNPTRSESSLRRGVLHNARPRADGRWEWRYDRLDKAHEGPRGCVDFGDLWEDVSAVRCPMMLVRGGTSTVVGDEDVSEWRRRQPASPVEVVEGAGHSIQGDRPLELAKLIDDFVFGGGGSDG
jgi:pimeloyl-ACP methyl ester carboxylesterase